MGLIAFAFGTAVIRGVVTSFAYQKNDFSDPYCASWLWRHGQNPYDAALASAVNRDRALSDARIVPIYPATAYVLVSPFSALPWRYANLLWTLLSIMAMASIAYMLPKLAGLSFAADRSWVLIACVACAAPLQTALHVGNSAVI